MAILDFLSGIFGNNIQDIAQNIPGADALGDVQQGVSDASNTIADATQGVTGDITDKMSGLTDQLPKL